MVHTRQTDGNTPEESTKCSIPVAPAHRLAAMLLTSSSQTQVQRHADAREVVDRSRENGGSRFSPERKSATSRLLLSVLRALLLVLVFGAALLGKEGTAHAAHIAMCSELGESIAAPPPLYAAKDVRIQGCDAEEMEEWDVPDRGRIPPQLDIPQRELEKSLVLPAQIIVSCEPTSVRRSLEAEEYIQEEHRSRLQRPPRS